MLMMKIQVGCQGWNYADWMTRAGDVVFYPRGTRSSEMLEVYARAFGTVEVDSTFYAVPSRNTLQGWFNRTPPNFRFSLKLPQVVTHEFSLRVGGFGVLREFCENVSVLREKLASVLVQLPPQFAADAGNLAAVREFLRELPTEIRFAVEFRERGWFDFETFELLAQHNVALCLSEGGIVPRGIVFHAAAERIADFVYVRFMGERDLTEFDRVRRPQDANLVLWRETLQQIAAHTPEILVYFSNFYEGHAPASANRLKQFFEQKIVTPEELETQGTLF